MRRLLYDPIYFNYKSKKQEISESKNSFQFWILRFMEILINAGI